MSCECKLTTTSRMRGYDLIIALSGELSAYERKVADLELEKIASFATLKENEDLKAKIKSLEADLSKVKAEKAKLHDEVQIFRKGESERNDVLAACDERLIAESTTKSSGGPSSEPANASRDFQTFGGDVHRAPFVAKHPVHFDPAPFDDVPFQTLVA